MIKKSNLKHGVYYYGHGRRSHIMQWDDNKQRFYFIDGIGAKSNLDFIEHWEDTKDTPYDGFLPILEIKIDNDYFSTRFYKKVWGKIPIIRKKLTKNAIMCPDGHIIESKHRHDYQVHEVDGKKYSVDGGLDYLKRSYPFGADVTEMCEWESVKHWILPENYVEGDHIDMELVNKYPLCRQFIEKIK